jgi:uncharacterized protein YcbK (DUF882 family)
MPQFCGGDQISRRRILELGCALTLACLPVPALARKNAGDPRSLGFLNIHTGERLSAVYWADGGYLPDALAEIDQLLRDYRTGEVKPIDRNLLDLLHLLRSKLDSSAPFHVISGYRSPTTNKMLAKRSGGVARKSLHMRGMAIDMNLPGRDLAALHRAARSLQLGGVGYYPKPGFVHLDVGRVRYW